MKKSSLLVLAVGAILALASCNPKTTGSSTPTSSTPSSSSTPDSSTPASSSETTIAITDLTVDASVSIKLGATAQLTVTITPDNATDKGFTCDVDNTAVCTVSNTGLITSVGAGTATVTVTSKGKKADGTTISKTVAVTVVEEVVAIKDITQKGSYCVKGKVVSMGSKGFFVDDGTGAIQFYDSKWTSDNTKGIAIGDYVKVKGDVSLQYQLLQFSYKSTIEKLTETAPTLATPAALTEAMLTATKTATTITPDKVVPVTFTAVTKETTYTNTDGTTGRYFHWTLSEDTAAIHLVFTSGYVLDSYNLALGQKYEITGYLAGYNTKYSYVNFVASTVTLVHDVATSVSITSVGDATSVRVDETLQLTAAVLPSTAVQTVTWTSSDTGVATVVDGLVTGLAVGQVVITATSTTEGITGTFNLTVAEKAKDPVTSVSVDPTTVSLKVGATQAITATVLPATANQNVVWTSSDDTVATVTSVGGVDTITAVKIGTATITATSSTDATKLASCVVTVRGDMISDITAAGTYDVKGVVGAINTVGFVLRDETAGIYVFQNAVPTVKVGDYVEVSGAVEVYNKSFQFAKTSTVTALTGTAPTLPNATALTSAIADEWKSGTNEVADNKLYTWDTVASYSGAYLMLNLAGSSTTIEPIKMDSSSFSFISGNTYTVSAYFIGYSSYGYAQVLLATESHNWPAATAVAITAAGNATSVTAGETLQLSATMTPANADHTLTWASSDDTVATVSAAGLVSGVKAGAVTITATSTTAGIKGTIALTVTAALNETAALTMDATSATGFTTASPYSFSTGYTAAQTFAYGGRDFAGYALGNQLANGYLRLGAKKYLTAMFGTDTKIAGVLQASTSFSDALSSVEVVVKAVKEFTSLQLLVYSVAPVKADGTTKETATPIDTVTYTSGVGTAKFKPTSGTTWAANSYYRLVVNKSSVASNGGVDITAITFNKLAA